MDVEEEAILLLYVQIDRSSLYLLGRRICGRDLARLPRLPLRRFAVLSMYFGLVNGYQCATDGTAL